MPYILRYSEEKNTESHCHIKDNVYLCSLEREYYQPFTDTGSVESQVALFSYRIARLTEHMKLNRKDYSTERALTMLVGKRRALLDYLKARDIERYRALVKELGLRK